MPPAPAVAVKSIRSAVGPDSLHPETVVFRNPFSICPALAECDTLLRTSPRNPLI
jgi:hypothetical protein